MRIRAGSTVLIPKTNRRPGDVSTAMAENASLSLEKPAPPAPKCLKPANAGKGVKTAKCAPATTTSKTTGKTASKGNSSEKNAASQHKSASTGLAKSAKNGSSAASSSNNGSKGASKSQ